ncbi:MAG: hypothetical protein ACOCXA_01800 [Planctomycetota bacterium]
MSLAHRRPEWFRMAFEQRQQRWQRIINWIMGPSAVIAVIVFVMTDQSPQERRAALPRMRELAPSDVEAVSFTLGSWQAATEIGLRLVFNGNQIAISDGDYRRVHNCWLHVEGIAYADGDRLARSDDMILSFGHSSTRYQSVALHQLGPDHIIVDWPDDGPVEYLREDRP